MYKGYQLKINKTKGFEESLSFDKFYFLTNSGDLEDIIPAFSKQEIPKQLDCTIIVKLIGDKLLTAHNTHNIIYKTYHFNLNNQEVLSQIVSFSSRPGDLESKDDFFIVKGTKNKFVVMETSFNTYNRSFYKNISENSVPCWIRVNIANRMAKNLGDWAKIFNYFNSKTHNSQWVLVDYFQFNSNKNKMKNQENIIWIVEQFYSFYKARDVSQILIEKSYFGSYNTPFDNEIWKISGYNVTYYNESRALIIKKNQNKIKNIEDIKWLILKNGNGSGDPLGIAPRADLLEKGAYAFGAVDGKAIDEKLIQENKVWIYSGPSKDNGLPAFVFEGKWESVPHRGIPKKMDFNWLKYTFDEVNKKHKLLKE